MRAQKWQRNSIYEAVEAGGLDPVECSFNYDEAPWRVNHLPSGSYFVVDGGPGHYQLTHLAGDGLPQQSDSYTWPTVPEKIERWAGDVKRDVDTPDLWHEVRQRQGLLTGAAYESSDNTPFTANERQEIGEQIRQIKEFLRESRMINEARLQSIAATLDYLVSTTDRMGRKDWALMFGGAILGALMADYLPREVVGDLLKMAYSVLGHLFGDGGGPQQLPPVPPSPPL